METAQLVCCRANTTGQLLFAGDFLPLPLRVFCTICSLVRLQTSDRAPAGASAAQWSKRKGRGGQTGGWATR